MERECEARNGHQNFWSPSLTLVTSESLHSVCVPVVSLVVKYCPMRR